MALPAIIRRLQKWCSQRDFLELLDDTIAIEDAGYGEMTLNKLGVALGGVISIQQPSAASPSEVIDETAGEQDQHEAEFALAPVPRGRRRGSGGASRRSSLRRSGSIHGRGGTSVSTSKSPAPLPLLLPTFTPSCYVKNTQRKRIAMLVTMLSLKPFHLPQLLCSIR